MATAEAIQQSSHAGEPEAADLAPIWPNHVEIEVIGLTGEYASGKTLFAMSIDPPNTLYLDFEKSGGSYANSMGVTRVDFPRYMRDAAYAEVIAKDIGITKPIPNKARYESGYKPIDVFKEFLFVTKNLPMNRYSVLGTDPISDVEQGLADYVKECYRDYGFSSAKAFENTGGIFWSHVKAYWKSVLADLAVSVQTFAFCTHTKTVWRGGSPTKDRDWKGKDTLAELASLFLWLKREAPKSGTNEGKVPDKPTAVVIKTRLSHTRYDPETGDVEIKPMLPPHLPVATPKAIREYILNPPDYSKLKKGERVMHEELTEDEKLQLQAEIARANADAAEKNLERESRRAELAAQTQEAMAKSQTPDQTAKVQEKLRQQQEEQVARAEQEESKESKNQEQEATDPPQSAGETAVESKGEGAAGKCSAELVAQLIEHKQKLGMPLAAFEAGIAKHTGGSTNPVDLTTEQAQEIIAKMQAAIEKKQ